MAKRKRKLTKTQAKIEAQRKRRQQQIIWAVGGIAAVAVIVVVVLVAMSGGQTELVAAEPLRDDIETGLTEEGYPYRGSADAPVTIVEFSDYRCPACRDYETTTADRIDEELVATGQVKYVVPPYALWQESLPIVEAAACAQDQDGFWSFRRVVFANQDLFPAQGTPSRALLERLAETSGLDVNALEACLDEGQHQAGVLASTQRAKTDLGVNSTPTFFVNGVQTQLLRDEPYFDTLRKAVEAAQASESDQ
jgi:protein-disulfide isomerase